MSQRQAADHAWEPRVGTRVVFSDPSFGKDIGTIGHVFSQPIGKVSVTWDSGITDNWMVADLRPMDDMLE